MLTLIKNAHVFAPEDMGLNDVLIASDKIDKIAPSIDMSPAYAEIIDVRGKALTPGYIDQHVHITGGGGEAGFHTRAPEINFSEFIKAGITTVVGLLGTDSETRSVENLVAKTKALNNEGMTAYCLTGSYNFPSPTITGSVKTDITFIDEIIGCKLAIADHRASFVNYETLAQLATQTRVAGMISGKAGTVTLHMGDDPAALSLVREVIKKTYIPMKHFIPTHCNRNPYLLKDAINYLKEGGNVDLTLGYDDGPSGVANIIARLKNDGVNTDKLTFTTDGNGSWSNYDDEGNLTEMGVSPIDVMHDEVVKLVERFGFTLTEALPYVTVNTANMLSLKGKGRIREGYDADMLILDDDLSINSVFMRGKCMMQNKGLLRKGTFEK